MAVLAAALASGILFGIGLGVSHMVNPAKVLAFLDVAGSWDPSLALVMAGAVAVTLPGYRLVLRADHPAFGPRFSLPTATVIDMRLIAGAALFGIGWGLVGICPGPAIASLAYGLLDTVCFVAAMAGGMVIARLFR